MTHAVSPARVLVIEDDPFLRKACATSLQQRGYAVLAAADGEAGLAMARAERPALILLDLLMPKITGLEVLRALKASPDTQDIPVLVLSNSSRADDRRRVQELGANGYLVKANLSLKVLGETVASLISDARR